jgi:hypothetical protein
MQAVDILRYDRYVEAMFQVVNSLMCTIRHCIRDRAEHCHYERRDPLRSKKRGCYQTAPRSKRSNWESGPETRIITKCRNLALR